MEDDHFSRHGMALGLSDLAGGGTHPNLNASVKPKDTSKEEEEFRDKTAHEIDLLALGKNRTNDEVFTHHK
jgi:hypothetical protein